jgi:hypothetical protein
MMEAAAGGNAPVAASASHNPFKSMLQGGSASGHLVTVRCAAALLSPLFSFLMLVRLLCSPGHLLQPDSLHREQLLASVPILLLRLLLAAELRPILLRLSGQEVLVVDRCQM